MAQTIKLKRSATQSAVPTTSQLELGEVAINTYDGRMFIKKNDGTESIVEVGQFATVTPAGSDGDLQFNSNGALGAVTFTFVDDVNNRLGIGTETPGTALEVSGTVTATTFDGALDFTNLTNLPDPTLTLTGDVSGSATFTDLGNATLTVTIANDSHTHDGRYYTETEADNRFVNVAGDTLTGFLTLHADPTNAFHAATKEYVDTVAAASLHYHTPVRLESPIALNATYNNGTNGVGATLTNAGTNAALSIDGVATSLNDRVLIYEQTNPAHNGVYTVTTVGDGSTPWVLTRATDADSYSPSDPDSFGQGDAFFVQEGNTGAGELYVMNTEGTITFGTTGINFVQISSAQIYSAGDGLDLTGTQFSHEDTSTQASVNNSGGTVIQDITLDTFGHITAIGSKTLSTTDITEGTNLYYTDARANTAIDARVTKTFVDNLNVDADTLDGQNGTYYLDWTNVTNKPDPTLTLDGDVSGSATFTNLGNATLTVTVADDSHNHVISNVDGLQTALNAKQDASTALTTTTTFSGDVSGTYNAIVVADDSHNHVISNVDGLQVALDAKQAAATAVTTTTTFGGDVTGTYDAIVIADNSHNHTSSNISDFTESVQDVVGGMVTTNTQNGISVTYSDGDGKLNFDVNDPTITLTGAVTGSGTITNLGNVSIATTNTADPTLTLTGDATGSATFTNLGNATLTVTVADDSHNHIISNVDGLQAALDAKQAASTAVTTTTTFGGDVSGTYDAIVIADDSHNHIIGNVDGLQAALDAKQAASTALTTSTTFGGDVSGTYNAIVVANDSHTHDGRYYTEAESDARFMRSNADDDFTGTLKHNNTGDTALFVRGGNVDTTLIRVSSTNNNDAENSLGSYGFSLRYMGSRSGNENSLSIFADNQTSATQVESLKINQDGVMYRGTNRLFDDGYHPNADKWTTARTLSLTGAVTGSASIDGSGNVSLATTATSDPTLTLSGDASGSATFTNLGNATLTVTVADDSHNHVISNVDGLQTALDAKQNASTALTTSTTFGGDVSGTYNAIVVADDSHNHIISNIDGLQTALNTKYESGDSISVANITATGYLRGPSTFTIDPAAHGDDTGTVVIAGNLQIDGTTTTINSTTVTIDDKNLVLASGAADASAANGAGLTVDGASATLLYNSAGDEWQLNKDLTINGNTAFHDGYHPNADKWTTARTLTLSGAVTGSASIDGSGNVTLSTTATSDPTLTLSGDASGSATFTNLGNATLTVTVADDSHNHVISNVDGLQTALNGKLSTTGGTLTGNLTLNSATPEILFNGTSDGGVDMAIKATPEGLDFYEPEDTNKIHFRIYDDTGVDAPFGYSVNGTQIVNSSRQLTNITYEGSTIWHAGNDGATSGLDADLLDGQHGSYYQPASSALTTSTTFGGDVSGTYNAIVIADDSHNHIISNVDGLQTALDGKLGSTANAVSASKWATARTITLGGVLSGSVSIDGSSNVTLTAAHTSDPTLTLTGDVTGTATFTNLGNATLTATVANDSHTHDNRYYTESESDSLFLNVAGDTMTGDLVLDGAALDFVSPNGTNTITLNMLDTDTLSFEGDSGQLFSITDSLTGTIFSVNDISGIPSIEVDSDGTVRFAEFSGNVLIGTSTDDGTNRLQVNGGVTATDLTVTNTISGSIDTADKWTTARTLSLTGAVTGSASIDGSGNVSIATTATSDPTITLTGAVTGSGTMTNLGNVSITTTATADPTLTLAGDASGSATFTNLGNATLTVTVADDSHNHVISNVDGLQTALDGKLGSSAAAVSADKWTTARTLSLTGAVTGSASIDGSGNVSLATTATSDPTLTLSGDASGSATFTNLGNATLSVTVADDSHNHVISNVDGLQTALDGKFDKSGGTITGNVTLSGADGENALTLSGSSPTMAFTDTTSGADDFFIHVNSNNFYILTDRGGVGGYNSWETPHPLVLETVHNIGYLFGSRIFADNYHPNADKWTTSRTLTLNGDVSGSVSWDGSANATLTVTVADDSHNHTIANIDGLQTALDNAGADAAVALAIALG